MNILQFNTSDIQGGAAIAGYRLHSSLRSLGHDSRLMVRNRSLALPEIMEIKRSSMVSFIARNSTKLIGLNYAGILGTASISKHPFFTQSDILNFHNLHGGYFNYLSIPSLTKKMPAVWTLHDMWSFTGHCTYSYDCDRWKTGCGSCPYPGEYPKIYFDNTRLEWRLKNRAYTNSNLHIVAPSKWLCDLAKGSMLNRFSVSHIPYGLDLDIYKPLDWEECRSRLGIPKNKKVLLFSAFNVEDRRKGGDLLYKALEKIPSSLKNDLCLLVIGEGRKVSPLIDGMDLINLGFIEDDGAKAVVYSSADLLVFPTRADNLPLVLQESMACGTPMVSFNVGGVPELVRPGLTGYLAEPEDPDSLVKGIVQLLEDDNLRNKMSESCRSIALAEYPLEKQARSYIKLYESILS
jgi:glycosyltransferase involved in cell wall biosynthesis